MSKAICPKCEDDRFEAVLQEVEHITIPIAIIKCKSCDTAIGVLDITTADRIKKLSEKR